MKPLSIMAIDNTEPLYLASTCCCTRILLVVLNACDANPINNRTAAYKYIFFMNISNTIVMIKISVHSFKLCILFIFFERIKISNMIIEPAAIIAVKSE